MRVTPRWRAVVSTMARETHPDEARVVLVTAPDLELARRLARRMVEQRLAACVNLVPGLTSVYRWQGRVEEEGEVLMVLKTSGGRLPEIEAFLAREHPSQVPECVALRPAEVERRYLDWLLASCAPAAEGD